MKLIKLITTGIAALSLVACNVEVEKVAGEFFGNSTTANPPPVANAGADFSENGMTLVTLDGSSSSDDKGISSYQWSQVSGKAVKIKNATGAVASFQTPNLDASMEFQLTVTDEEGKSVSDNVTVTSTAIDAELVQAPNGYCLRMDGELKCQGDAVSETMQEQIGSDVKWGDISFHNSACALSSGQVYCEGGFGSPSRDLVNPIDIGTGRYHACALDDSGVVCWVDTENASSVNAADAYGLLNVPALTNPTDIIVGYADTCAVHNEGELACWGRAPAMHPAPATNDFQIALGFYGSCTLENQAVTCKTSKPDSALTNVPTLNTPTKIDVNIYGEGACALDAGELICWGDDFNDLPQDALGEVSDFYVSYTSVCANTEYGVQCQGWRYNSPFDYPDMGVAGIEYLDGEWASVCARNGDDIQCWGRTFWGSLIDDKPDSFSNVIDFDTGESVACAIDDSGLNCWGIADEFGATDILANAPTLNAYII